MKQAVLLCTLLLISTQSKSQTLQSNIPQKDTSISSLVQNTKRVIIFRQENPAFEIYQSTIGEDTTISVFFKDTQYTYLTQYGHFYLTKQELKMFIDYWYELTDKKHKADESKIQFSSNIIFSKIKVPLQILYEMDVLGKDGGEAMETKTQLERMRQGIYNYLADN